MVLTEAFELSNDAVDEGCLWGDMAPPNWHSAAAYDQKGSSIVLGRRGNLSPGRCLERTAIGICGWPRTDGPPLPMHCH
ncbi:hypothetical protein HNY73_000800 [Argiope bruennichi]|uniref:Uncharacterized protein n=1 Tax=Argiope bruennichi TaxID=94029 RepID=A0A8T0G1W0_ARGBR|nr:hypothetical protein HNY73_000800 [Argiope bruennichi]